MTTVVWCGLLRFKKLVCLDQHQDFCMKVFITARPPYNSTSPPPTVTTFQSHFIALHKFHFLNVRSILRSLLLPVCVSSAWVNWLIDGGTFSLWYSIALCLWRRMFLGHRTKRERSRFGCMSCPTSHKTRPLLLSFSEIAALIALKHLNAASFYTNLIFMKYLLHSHQCI